MLSDLPKPPAGKTGWPWTEGSSPPTSEWLREGAWPRISVVTPSYNQSDYLEETIRSVLLQGYPDHEYIVIDGESTDESADILSKYEPWLSYWASEPDRGQPHALNKGFARCAGQLLGWINSDDFLMPGALFRLANAHQRFPDSILLADVLNVDSANGYRWEISQRGVTFQRMSQPWRYGCYLTSAGYLFHAIRVRRGRTVGRVIAIGFRLALDVPCTASSSSALC